MIVILLALTVLGCMLGGCDQRSAGGHMMGGGMMGKMPGADNGQTLPEPRSEEARLFRRYCGQCHAPPAPTAHTAREWPQVVDRMKQHMMSQGKAMPDTEQLREITDYLQSHAE